MRASASSAWPSSAGDRPRYHKGEGGLSGCAPDEPVACMRLLCNHVNCKYLPGRAPPTPPTHQRIVTLGWLSVEQKSRPKRSGRGASGMDRRGGPEGREREREKEDRLKIPKWITPLRSWNRLEEGRIRHCCPHEWKFPFFSFVFEYRGSSIVRSFLLEFFICIGIWECSIDNW